MDKIFREIKKAIEEEMRNAERGPAPTGAPPRQGGQRAREYADWLKEEQERLRGNQPVETAEPRENVRREDVRMEVPTWEDQLEQSRQNDEERRIRRLQERRQTREPSQEQRQSTQYGRAEARHQRRTDTAYQTDGKRRSALKRQVHRLLQSPNGMRQAFVLREIVSKPVSLRNQDDHLNM